MAKKNGNNGNGGEIQEPSEAATYTHDLPEGYEERSSDVAGFWDMKLPIHFIPLSAKLFDSNIEKAKISALIIGKAVGAHHWGPDEDGVVSEIKDGDTIGVWAKPGMSAIKDLAGVKVYMYYAGELETGKPNPMKVFKVSSPKDAKGSRLLVTEDFRKNSLNATHFLLEGGPSRPSATPSESSRV